MTFKMSYDWSSMAGFIENERKELLPPWSGELMTIQAVVVLGLAFAFAALMKYQSPINVIIALLIAVPMVGLLIVMYSTNKQKDNRLQRTLKELDNASEDYISVDSSVLHLHHGDPARMREVRHFTTEGLEMLKLTDIKMAILWISMPDGNNIGAKNIALFWQGLNMVHDTYLHQMFLSDPVERLLDVLAASRVQVRVAWSGLTKFNPKDDLKRMANGQEPQYLLFHHEYMPGKIYSPRDYFLNKKL